jgi:aminoglycoside phosphotransferase family enzyme/predicted kinase
MSSCTTPESSLALIKALAKMTSSEIVETHISWVLLTDQYAYKIKKPVNFGFLDFSTLEKRRFCCEEELRLNKRLAAELYLGVEAITGTADYPQLGGTGTAIEYAVKMTRFRSGQLLSQYAKLGQLNSTVIDQLADTVAEFHQTIDRTDQYSPYGDSAGIRHWFVENFDHIGPLLTDDVQKQQLQQIQRWGENESKRLDELIQNRKKQGYVRECHGDLHLGNITLTNGKAIPFDCIEFNPMLRRVDVISEAAFLFIDLLHFGYEHLAYRFLNRYLQHTGDYQGLALLRYYSVYRALVRAKVALLRLAQCQHDDAVAGQARDEYAIFADLAERCTRQRRTALLITHGFSGSGKSVLAAQVAEKIGAFRIRSDIERKRLFGFSADAQTGNAVDGGIYAEQASKKTYQYLQELAQTVLAAGFPVIIDATFLKTEQRDLFRQLAKNMSAPFCILSLQASEQELHRRLNQRQGDASEATVAVLHRQQQSAHRLSEQELADAILIDGESENALATVLERLSL